MLGGVAFIVSFLSMGLIAGVDFSRRYILVQLDPETVQALFAGPTRLLFLGCGVAFLIGVLLFGAATLRAGVFPRAAILLYVIGFVPYALSPFFPAPLVTAAQAIGAVGVAWLGWALWTGERSAAGRRELAAVA